MLKNAKKWSVDPTFRLVKLPFTQLYSINCYLRKGYQEKLVPTMYVFMSERTTKDYKPVISEKVNLVDDSPYVEEVILDFEKALWLAFNDVLLGVKLRGCA